ncbi:MAG: FTR1 family protein [Alcanivorax sp.]|nr:FTR1 family protein [Alcanivorax sp.]
MLSSAIIVFREVLEAALIVSIVMACTRGVNRRGWWVAAGVGVGLLGALLVAVSAELISAAFQGVGQEAFNAFVLLAAVLMLAWHNIWMASHGREIATRLSSMGKEVLAGQEPMYALALAICLAVLREGSEVVLFLSGIAAGGSSSLSMLSGSLLGVVAGALAGYFLYSGLVRIPVKQFFTVTTWMILLLASGLAASAAGFLEQAGWLPALQYSVWDTSGFLSEHSLLGQVLHTLVGYQARPSGIQLVFYVATFVVTLVLMQWVTRRDQARVSQAV